MKKSLCVLLKISKPLSSVLALALMSESCTDFSKSTDQLSTSCSFLLCFTHSSFTSTSVPFFLSYLFSQPPLFLLLIKSLYLCVCVYERESLLVCKHQASVLIKGVNANWSDQ